MFKSICKIGITILLHGSIAAQIAPDSLFARTALLADLDSLRATIIKSHPDPFAFCGSVAFNEIFQESKAALNLTTSLSDFSLIVAKCLNTMKDSHTCIDYIQLQSMQLLDSGYYLPLSFKRVNNENSEEGFDLVFSDSWSKGIADGSKLLSINSRPAHDIYREVMEFACTEGDALIAQNSVAAAIFPLINGLRHTYGEANIIRYLPLDGSAIHEINLPGYRKKEFEILRKQHEKDKPSWLPVLTIDKEASLAVLKVGTFAPSKRGAYSAAIKRSIIDVKNEGIQNLAIDIRGNGGGSSAWVEFLYSFLDKNGYNTPNNVIGKNSLLAESRSRLFHSGFAQLIVKLFFRHDEDVQSYQYISSLPFGNQDTVYFNKPTIQSKSLVFEGNCFLIIDGLTASAGVDFTNAFKTRNRGLVIGEQCLGPATGTWGNPAKYELPNSKLKVTIATIRYNYDNSFRYEMNGIEPDYPVGFVADDLANKIDTQVEFIKNLIKEKK